MLTALPGDENILNEFYLTTVAGNARTKVAEIGFFWNAAGTTVGYFNSGTACSSYTDPTGRKWNCRYLLDGSAGKYIMFYSGGQVFNTTLYSKAMLASLVSKGLVSDALYVNRVAIGVEPVRGAG